jgi:hypothetical protein
VAEHALQLLGATQLHEFRPRSTPAPKETSAAAGAALPPLF